MIEAAIGSQAAGVVNISAVSTKPILPASAIELGAETDGHVAADRTQLTVHNLLESLKASGTALESANNSQLFQDVTALKRRADDGKTATTVVPEPTAKRIERTVAYSTATKELTHQWQERVKQNREADVLQFSTGRGLRKRTGTSTLAHTFKPSNALEAEIEAILKEEG
eukprot:SAG31_NODE_15883_length_733_cov_1.847003_1_plen_169_part_10